MGCTPSKSSMTYTQERVCRDLDTCSTFVPNFKSSVSTPERPSPRVETNSGKQTFLSVPCRDNYGRSISQPSTPDAWSTAAPTSPLYLPHFSVQPSCKEMDS
ncbi:hypothetical protein UPYG_G00318540 [Umbra pygmaea]|uniref:Uncharacterized protein n=1 Tax=Umbra pygmaea TaxID=75934 RepID=A0ABD0W096_UMBPY